MRLKWWQLQFSLGMSVLIFIANFIFYEQNFFGSFILAFIVLILMLVACIYLNKRLSG